MDAARLFVRVSVIGADQAQRALQGMGDSVTKTQRGFDRFASGAGNVVAGITKIGIVAASLGGAGLAYAARQAISFEDAFAGVRKTVGGSEADLGKLNTELRNLSTRIPVKFTDLAGIAQEAGALGVASGDVAEFTDVVSRLSAATVGLTPEAAAEAFGKLGNVLQLRRDDYERLGSALVELGNNAASSEGDIIEVAKRFGAAGHQAGLSAAQILGMSSAIASLGVEPEAAGSALSRIFNKITTFIGTGDKKLQAFAKVTGTTVKEFSRAWATDASGSFEKFLASLSKLDRFSAARLLKEGGITNVRDVNAILLLSQNYAELSRQIDISSKAYDENTELQKVSEERFKTLQNQLVRFGNLVRLGAAELGEGFTPALGRLVDKISTFVNTHRGDLVRIGKDIGDAIDRIDWGRVETAALAVAGTVRTIYEVISKIPAEIDLIVAGFLGFNKITGGALGQVAGGAVDIVGGLATLGGRAAAGRGGRLGGAAGALGRLTATPVYVTGVAPGVSLGGGPAGLLGTGAAGGGGGLLGLLTKGTLVVTVGAIAIDAATTLAQAVTNVVDPALQDAINRGETTYANRDPRRFNAAGQVVANMPGAGTGGRGLANPILDRGGRESGRPGFLQTWVNELVKAGTDAVRAPWRQFAAIIRSLQVANTPANVRAAAEAAVESAVTKRRGNVEGTRALIAGLKGQLAKTDDPETRKVLQRALREISAKLPGRIFADKQLDKADDILRSNKSNDQKLADLKVLQNRLINRGLPGAAAKINQKAEEVRAASKAAGQLAANAIKEKDLSVEIGPTYVSVPISVSLRETMRVNKVYAAVGGGHLGPGEIG